MSLLFNLRELQDRDCPPRGAPLGGTLKARAAAGPPGVVQGFVAGSRAATRLAVLALGSVVGSSAARLTHSMYG